MTPPNSIGAPTRSQRWWVALLGVGFGFGALLQMQAMLLPYWYDEATALFFVHRPWLQMLEVVSYDMHPPVSFILLKSWVALVGDAPVATAVLPLAFSLVTLWFTWRLGRLLFTPVTAALGTLLYWLSATGLFYSTDIWTYAPAIAAATASTYYLVRLGYQSKDRAAWVGYAVATILAMYTHYAFFLLWYAQQLVVAVIAWRRRAFPLRAWLWLQLTLVVVFSPWLPIMIRQLYLNHMVLPSLQLEASTSHWSVSLVHNFRELLLFPGSHPLLQVLFWLPILLGAFLLTVRRQVDRAAKTLTMSVRPWPLSVLVLLILVALPNLVVTVVQVTRWPWRYLTLTGPLLALLAATLALSVSQRSWWRHGVAVAMLCSALIVNHHYVFNLLWQQGTFQWPKVAAYLESQARPQDVILFGAFEERLPFSYYYHGQTPVLGFLPTTRDPRLPTGEFNEIVRLFSRVVYEDNIVQLGPLLAPYQRIWLVSGYSTTFMDPDGLVEGWLRVHCQFAGRGQVVSPYNSPVTITPYRDCRQQVDVANPE